MRSGAEVRALEVLRAAGRPLPRLNVRIAGEEADLSWSRQRLIVEARSSPRSTRARLLSATVTARHAIVIGPSYDVRRCALSVFFR